jgi:LacI family transcriptional regulator
VKSSGSSVTIRDIARKLGISHATVSRALGEHPKINSLTRARVRAEAEKMGYVPNASARTIRNAHSRLVGLVIPDIQNDFYATVAKRLADTLASKGYQLALSVTEDDPEREMRDVRAMLEARAAGVVVTLTGAPRSETLAMLRNIRAVQLVRRNADLDADAVTIDDHSGTHAATSHLIQCGHRAIAFIGTTTTLSSGQSRLSGFRQAMEEAGLDASTTWLGSPRPEFARQAISLMLRLKTRPTGLVLGSSELTLGALQGLQVGGMRYPQDISIVGYGDPLWFSLAGDGITTVHLPVAEIAAMVAALVLDGLQEHNTDAESVQTVTSTSSIRPALVLRGSTRALNPAPTVKQGKSASTASAKEGKNVPKHGT